MNIAALFFLISIFVVPGIWLLLTRAKRMQAQVDHEFLARISNSGRKGERSESHQDWHRGRDMDFGLDASEAVNHVSITSPYGRDW